jgi:hypothetical protein
MLRSPRKSRTRHFVAALSVVALTFGLNNCGTKGNDGTGTLTGPLNPPEITASTIANTPFIVGTPYSDTLRATGGDGSYSWIVLNGSLPSGLTLASTGVVSGTPVAVGTSKFTVQVTSGALVATQAFTVSVSAPPIAITTTSLVGAIVGTAYIQTLSATGGTGSYAWAIASGSLPNGLTLSTSGAISGTPTVAGTTNFSVQVTSGSLSATQALSVTITAPLALSITNTTVPAAVLGVAYSFALQAAGGTGGIAWSIASGSLPGLSLGADGIFFGTAIATGTYNIVVQATGGGQNAMQALAVSVVAPNTLVTITTTSLPDRQVGVYNALRLLASGGFGTYVWSIASGSLPTGLALFDDGIIGGTPSTGGTFNITVQVISGSSISTKALALVVDGAGTLSIATTTLPNATVGIAYSQTLLVTGGTGGYGWTVANGSLPLGLTLSNAGVLSGTPTSSGTSNFAVQVTSGTQAVVQPLSIVVAAALTPLSIVTTSFSNGTVGVAYTQTLQATGGTGSYTWSVTAGSLPAGLSLSTAGILSGTPTSAATSNFTVQVASGSSSATEALGVTITLAPLAITSTTLPAAVVGTPYADTLKVVGGTGVYAWSLLSGSLPGLTLFGDGIISGVAVTTGTYNLVVQVTSGTQTAMQALSVTITGSASLAIATTSLTGGIVGTAYSQALQATGGTGSYVWSVVSGSVPTGTTLSSMGVISGTPTTAATSNFTVQVTSGSATATQALSVSVVAASTLPVSITTTTLPSATVGAAYAQTLQATGGNGTYMWSLMGGSLPAGLTLSSGGVVSGTLATYPVPVAGRFSFLVQVASGTQTAAVTLNITVSYPPLTITTGSLPVAVIGTAYSQALQSAGGAGPEVWSLVAQGASLPAGLRLSTDGVISGNAQTAGGFTFAVQVTDGIQTATHTFSITVVYTEASLAITVTSLAGWPVGTPYSQALQATGGTGVYSWSVASGSLPAGLTLSGGGLLSGTPSATGTSNFTVQATSGGATATQALSMTVTTAVPTLAITTTSLSGGVIGAPYSQALQATGGTGVYSWSVASGSLPAGLTLSGGGLLSGTPSATGTSNFTVEAISQASSGTQTATQALTVVVVTNAAVYITTTSFPNGTAGIAYSQTLNAIGGTGSYTWSFIGGELPSGMTLSSAGVLSGTVAPGQASTYGFTVQVTSGSASATQALSLTVLPAGVTTLVITTTTLAGGDFQLGTFYSRPLQATGGTGVNSWSLASGSLPPGFTLSSAGVLSGTPTATGTSNFTVQVTSGSQTATQALNITVIDPTVVTVTTMSLAGGMVDAGYGVTLQASGGTGTSYTWSVVSGSLPAGLTLSSGGLISGTPTVAETSAFTVRAASGSASGTQALSLVIIANPSLSITASLSNGAVGTPYSQTLKAVGGTGIYTWSVVSGSLPAGLTLSSGGVLSGTPTVSASYSFTIEVTSGTSTAAQAFGIEVDVVPPVSITTTGLPAVAIGTPYSQTLQAMGGTGGYAWSVGHSRWD